MATANYLIETSKSRYCSTHTGSKPGGQLITQAIH
jgi:hypothetical protein